MSEFIQNNKFVELSYKVIDHKSGLSLVQVDFPIGYVHGQNCDLDECVTNELEGKKKGDFV